MSKTIVMVIAHDGYQPIEYGEPKRQFLAAGYKVITASNKSGTATAKDKSSTPVDVLIDDVDIQNCDAVVFIGGPGAMDNLDNESSYELLRQAFADEKVIAAICVAPRILAKSGILTNVTATGWDEDGQLKSVFDEYEVRLIPGPVVVEQDIITATGPAAAGDFARDIIRVLNSKTT